MQDKPESKKESWIEAMPKEELENFVMDMDIGMAILGEGTIGAVRAVWRSYQRRGRRCKEEKAQ